MLLRSAKVILLMPQTLSENIKTIRELRQLAIPQLATLSGISEERLRKIEAGSAKAAKKDLQLLALTLKVPPIAFRLSKLPELPSQEIDFRTVGNKPAALSAIGAKAVQESLKRVRFINTRTKSNQRFDLGLTLTLSDDPEDAGRRLRKKLQISNAFQLESTPSQFFRFLANAIQLEGAFVFKRSAPVVDFRGFTANTAPFRLILINTKDATVPTQIFTLAHELVHLALDMTGISDPRSNATTVERFCNKVAAAMLAPPNLIRPLTENHRFRESGIVEGLAYLSGKTKISLFANALRLEELGLVSVGYANRYIALTKNLDRDSIRKGGGLPGEYDYGAQQIWRFGSRYLTELGHLIDRKEITFLDAEALLGISESKIVQLIGQASQEQQEITDQLDTIVLESFSDPLEGYKFEVV